MPALLLLTLIQERGACFVDLQYTVISPNTCSRSSLSYPRNSSPPETIAMLSYHAAEQSPPSSLSDTAAQLI